MRPESHLDLYTRPVEPTLLEADTRTRGATTAGRGGSRDIAGQRYSKMIQQGDCVVLDVVHHVGSPKNMPSYGVRKAHRAPD